jgi:hypothetical protein
VEVHALDDFGCGGGCKDEKKGERGSVRNRWTGPGPAESRAVAPAEAGAADDLKGKTG